MFMNENISGEAFGPGMYYIGLYSFCLTSCNYCHKDIDYIVQISKTTDDLNRCRPTNQTVTSTTTAAIGTTGSPVESVGTQMSPVILLFIVIFYLFI